MLLLALAGRTIGGRLRRAILTIAQAAAQPDRDVPPEFYKFPLF
jgi:hypothetical protein